MTSLALRAAAVLATALALAFVGVPSNSLGGSATRCTASDCEPLPSADPAHRHEVVTLSSRLLSRYASEFVRRTVSNVSHAPAPPAYMRLRFRSSRLRQTIRGFGGAFTDAAAQTLASAAPGVQEQIMQAYFGAGGARYSLCRVPIGGSDFSATPYSYEDTRGNFSVQRDEAHKLPMIRRAQSLSRSPIKILASPWSAPAWMKDSQSLVWGHLVDADAWAHHLARFVGEYSARGVNVSYLTIQNEPDFTLGPLTRLIVWWNSMAFTPREMARFLGSSLGPMMRSAHPHVKMLVGDDQRKNMNAYLGAALADAQASKYVDGAGFHWYATAALSWIFPWAPWAGINLASGWKRVAEATDRDPSLEYISTEITEGFEPSERGPRIGEWLRLERFAYGIIRDMQAGSMGLIDWNLVLDHNGGPNWAGNQCDAAILLSADGESFWKQPMYYAMAHFSRFVPAGSRVAAIEPVEVGGDRFLGCAACIDIVGFVTPDELAVVVVLNRGEEEHCISLTIAEEHDVRACIPAHSLHTMAATKS